MEQHAQSIRKQRISHGSEYEHPMNFDERAKKNMQNIMNTHEFRKKNIEKVEPLEKDYFEYDPKDKNKYDAMKFEHIFRFGVTYKAIKWGICVGSLFAFHRYYRSRDIQNAAHWFTCISFLSFFNIWLSFGIQDFITDYSTRKSRSLAARNEYHTNVYKDYLDELSETVESIDEDVNVTPVLHNSSVESLKSFADNYDDYLIERFKMRIEDNDINDNDEIRFNEGIRAIVIKKNILDKKNMSKEDIIQLIKNIEIIDRKSMDFNNDIFNVSVY